MTYREYAKNNVPSRTDIEIEAAVSGLFGADDELGEPFEIASTCAVYNIEGYTFYMNNSSFDTVAVIKDGNIMDSWELNY
jgi:hypothetical protein